jgi:S1-C subfamily serine protease
MRNPANGETIMRGEVLLGSVSRLRKLLIVGATVLLASGYGAPAQTTSVEALLSGVVKVKTFINPDGRTLQNLGRQREGSGIVIDNSGLILTIGYLMVEAHAAEVVTNDGRAVPADVVGYDNETGFGLLRAIIPLKVPPIPFGKSAGVKERDAVIVASFGGTDRAVPAMVVAKREFAGNWEYLVEDALFTSPPHQAWSGAALLDHQGKLIGVGSLIVGDATGRRDNVPGNMFVPIDMLPPILADLMTEGHASGPAHPWIGMTTDDRHGHLTVNSLTKEGPAEKSGLRKGDVILAVGGEQPKGLADLYRKMWAQGAAGTVISFDVIQNSERRHVDVKSMNRLDHLRLKSTF